MDTKGLWPAELLTRTDNEYRDGATEPGQFRFLCNNYQKPKVAGSCATCTTVKGPINPWAGARPGPNCAVSGLVASTLPAQSA